MKCSQCDNEMIIAKSLLISELDSTDVYTHMQMVCPNANCPMFGGVDLKNPTKVHEHKMKAN